MIDDRAAERGNIGRDNAIVDRVVGWLDALQSEPIGERNDDTRPYNVRDHAASQVVDR